MRRYSRIPLSEASDWKGILITPIVTPGTLVHQPTKLSKVLDEVYLWAENQHTSAVTVTVEFGGTTAGDLMVLDLPVNSSIQIVKGRPMSDNLAIKVFASVTNVVNIWGYINRIHDG